jgi:C1A family cysteine protease
MKQIASVKENKFRIVARLLLFMATFYSMDSLFAQNKNPELSEVPVKYQIREKQATTEQREFLKKIRQDLQKKGSTFNVGFTSVFDSNLDELTRKVELSDKDKMFLENQIKGHNHIGSISIHRREALFNRKITCSANSEFFDARNYGHVTPIRDQLYCNSWAFATAAGFETSYLKVNGGNPNHIDISEMMLLRCVSRNNGCRSGLPFQALRWMVETNSTLCKESQFPYYVSSDRPSRSEFVNYHDNLTCEVQNCRSDYVAEAWGFVRPDNHWNQIAKKEDIKKAICEYGSVIACVEVTRLWFGYISGVLNDSYDGDFIRNLEFPSANHVVLIVGWCDAKKAWLIKNSWTENWGIDGFAWVDYDSYHIGKMAVWVKAKPKRNWLCKWWQSLTKRNSNTNSKAKN